LEGRPVALGMVELGKQEGREPMNFVEAITHVRRKLGLIFPWREDDLEYFTKKIVSENQEVFDRLAKS